MVCIAQVSCYCHSVFSWYFLVSSLSDFSSIADVNWKQSYQHVFALFFFLLVSVCIFMFKSSIASRDIGGTFLCH